MFVIGERLNGMFMDVRKGIQTKDKSIIQKVALDQIKAGANALDINVGPASDKPLETMVWLVEAVQDGSFFHNPALVAAAKAARDAGSPLHLIGLYSEGGVHSHSRHLCALIELCLRHQVTPHFDEVPVPGLLGQVIDQAAALGGRDDPPAVLHRMGGRHLTVHVFPGFQRLGRHGALLAAANA